jgi:hypothetical protein
VHLARKRGETWVGVAQEIAVLELGQEAEHGVLVAYAEGLQAGVVRGEIFGEIWVKFEVEAVGAGEAGEGPAEGGG